MEHAVVRHAPAETSDLNEVLDGIVVQRVVLGKNDLHPVTLLLGGARGDVNGTSPSPPTFAMGAISTLMLTMCMGGSDATSPVTLLTPP